MFRKYLVVIGLSIIFLAACVGDANPSGNNQAEYDSTKKMVVDILQTEDGKKALQEILADEQLKQELVLDSEVVKDSINETLTSDKGIEMWKTLFEDPKFVKEYAASMEDAHNDLMKKLMNDSAYQEKMIELLQDPKMDEQMVTVLKSQDFRSHLEKTIQETLETPTFQAKIQEILLKAAEEQGSQSGGQGGSGGDSGSGGGQSGGGSDSGGGGGGQ